MSEKLKRALTVADVENYRPKLLPFEGKWRNSFGTPEQRGSILIYGMPKNGKTDLAMQLAVYLTRFGRVAYNSVEEGVSAGIREAIRRNRVCEVAKRFHLLDRETIGQLTARLKRKQSADFIFIDSVQRIGMTTREYEVLKDTFPNKLFILISHVDDAKNPDGKTAKNIKRYSDAFAFVDGFVARPVCRIDGGEPFVIWPEKAAEVGAI
jgi:hypothetical protein